MCSVVKNWQTMAEAHIDVKTTDGYLLCLLCVGFTKKQQSDSEDLLCSAPTGPSNREEHDGQHLKEVVRP